MRLDSVSAMDAFVLAADLRSFKAAGQQMGLSSSAVGKAVARLEEQLGVRLFHRSTRSIALTHEGGLFLERCRKILSEIEAAEGEVAEASAQPRGRLRVSLPLADTLLTSVFGMFLEAYPEIELDLDYNDRLVDVIEEGFDAVIRTGDPSDSRLLHRSLGTFSWRLVAAPIYLDKRGVPTTPADLVQHVCLRHRYPETGKLEGWGVSLPDNGIVPAALCASTIEPLLQLAVAGRGITQLPSFTVGRHLAAGTLVEVLAGSVTRTGALRLLWPSSRYPLPKVRAFVDFMSEHVAAAIRVADQ